VLLHAIAAGKVTLPDAWFGRPDFKFHVYAKSGNDVDTGLDFTKLDFLKKIAGGGTPGDDPVTPLGKPQFDL